jgi:hypothetical protein
MILSSLSTCVLVLRFKLSNVIYFTPQIHNMMTECWNGDPGLRPTFKKLAQSVDTFRDSEEGWGTLPGGLYWWWPGPAHMITLSIVKCFATVCPNQYNPDDALTLKRLRQWSHLSQQSSGADRRSKRGGLPMAFWEKSQKDNIEVCLCVRS